MAPGQKRFGRPPERIPHRRPARPKTMLATRRSKEKDGRSIKPLMGEENRLAVMLRCLAMIGHRREKK
jgi:hypothetical protein